MTKASSFFTSENRAQHIVTVDLLLEEFRRDGSTLEGMEEWLFTLQPSGSASSAVRNAMSYAVLSLSSKCIPHLLEIGATIRDFINCGYVTSLQVSVFHLIQRISNHRINAGYLRVALIVFRPWITPISLYSKPLCVSASMPPTLQPSI